MPANFVDACSQAYSMHCNRQDPLVSPLYGDLHGLPSLLIQAGEDEILLSDAKNFAGRARQAGVDVTLEVYPGMWHVWQIYAPYLPEAQQALESVANYISKQEYQNLLPQGSNSPNIYLFSIIEEIMRLDRQVQKELPLETPSRKQISVVTDSTADLPLDLLEKYAIQSVPLYLIMGDKNWRDRVDITPDQFYELLKTSPDFPKTSQPNVAEFQELFSKLSQETQGIVAVLVSSKLSGTVASAQAARANLPAASIEIVDSLGVSMMLGFPVLAAAKAAAEGKDLQTVAAAARAAMEKSHVYFIVDTMEYLYRGGRIGAAAKFLASALNIKPIIEIREGEAKPAGQARTLSKALKVVMDLVAAQISAGQTVHMAVVNVAAKEEASRFKEILVERFHPAEILMVDCSPVLGAHVGPGTVGLAYYLE